MKTKILDLYNIVAAFVREQRISLRGGRSSNNAVDRREKDFLWIDQYYIALYASLTYWRRDGKDSINLERLIKEFVRCLFNY